MLKLQFLCNFSLTLPTIEKLKTKLYYSEINALQSIISTLTTSEFINFYTYIIFCKEILEGKGALLVENYKNYCDVVGNYLIEHPEEIPYELKSKQYEEEKIQIPTVDYIIPKQRKKKVKPEKKNKEEKLSLKVSHKNNQNLEKEETTDTTTTSLKPVDFDQNCVFEFPNLGKTEIIKNNSQKEEVQFKEDFPQMISEPPPTTSLKKQKFRIGKNWEINNTNPLLSTNTKTVTEEFPSLIKNQPKSKAQSPIKDNSPLKPVEEAAIIPQKAKKQDELDYLIDGYFDTNNQWVSLNQNDIQWQQVRQEQFNERKEQAIGKVGRGKNKKVLLKGGFV